MSESYTVEAVQCAAASYGTVRVRTLRHTAHWSKDQKLNQKLDSPTIVFLIGFGFWVGCRLVVGWLWIIGCGLVVGWLRDGYEFVLRLSWLGPVCVLGVSWVGCGMAMGLSCVCPGFVLGVSWVGPGMVLGWSWFSPRVVLGLS